MNIILIIILFLLIIFIDKKRGVKLFLSLFFNFLILMILFYFIAIGFNPIVCSLLGCLAISYILLFFVNGENLNTQTSFKSIIIVLIILAILIYITTTLSRVAGFGYESLEEINMFSYDIKIDFTSIAISLVLISLIGATVDASIAISSALFEIYDNNKHLSKKELFKSGMNIGKDILCTSVNTLLFAFLADFMTLVIWYYKGHYSFLDIINSKTFASEFIRIMISAIGCFLAIPITSFMTTKAITNLEETSKLDKNSEI